jgi:hypothetical protein
VKTVFEIFDDHDVSLNRILKIIPQSTLRRARREDHSKKITASLEKSYEPVR